ncbi:cytochrome c oxidase subunit 6A1, mitochondrial-like [Hylaeus volcanicus]|uniref:cytochrome c oxidase subunit 6A1, mitochondrial-like n=1 Tax=Hylaeus volcanicus TaxID=313075 RepID=UPI0023B77BE0|nr:cytochrome c oxidase subunit 6A1, mitochondrial-like [Hylaeus volcanicus]
MLNVSKVGQFGHVFKRGMSNIVETVEQRCHETGEGSVKLWRNISLFIGLPAIALAMVNCFIRHQQEDHHERPEFIHYPYMKVMNKPFPWGDGKHSLFHNPKVNWIPGVGYEE